MFGYQYKAVVTYKCNGEVYEDSFGCDVDITRKEIRDMFEMNHAMEGDLKECRIISIGKFLKG
jgi:hypothetical protein